ncbi:hypothetical protein B0H15DRAFT_800452 [Mycena belliarum]|uniref:Uncharacterized protein n=1 Tax=Mycena belliarum TaxID=1033014 RepID=A0AAD6U9H2_9AGAR|nr:hypothetical protein B0H15DRAFT_800452 [Mycena belliae]
MQEGACFSPSVPASLRAAWVKYGGSLTHSKEDFLRANFFFCNGPQDPWLNESLVVLHAGWVSKSVFEQFALPVSRYILDAFGEELQTAAKTNALKRPLDSENHDHSNTEIDARPLKRPRISLSPRSPNSSSQTLVGIPPPLPNPAKAAPSIAVSASQTTRAKFYPSPANSSPPKPPTVTTLPGAPLRRIDFTTLKLRPSRKTDPTNDTPVEPAAGYAILSPKPPTVATLPGGPLRRIDFTTLKPRLSRPNRSRSRKTSPTNDTPVEPAAGYAILSPKPPTVATLPGAPLRRIDFTTLKPRLSRPNRSRYRTTSPTNDTPVEPAAGYAILSPKPPTVATLPGAPLRRIDFTTLKPRLSRPNRSRYRTTSPTNYNDTPVEPAAGYAILSRKPPTVATLPGGPLRRIDFTTLKPRLSRPNRSRSRKTSPTNDTPVEPAGYYAILFPVGHDLTCHRPIAPAPGPSLARTSIAELLRAPRAEACVFTVFETYRSKIFTCQKTQSQP